MVLVKKQKFAGKCLGISFDYRRVYFQKLALTSPILSEIEEISLRILGVML